MSMYTIVGGKGFIGSEMETLLLGYGHEVFIPEKNDSRLFEVELGTVIYCAGNGDCKNTPFKVVDSNINLLANVLQSSKFDKLIYISSTRLYMGNIESNENVDLIVGTLDDRRLFNLTKLVAEELCLKSDRNAIVIRPSNVYGVALSSPLFLPAITRNAILNGVVDMYISPEYNKDYVSVIDVSQAIYDLSQTESLRSKVYNIAAGQNTTAQDIADVLQKETGCKINWLKSTTDEQFPINDIMLLQKEVSFKPRDVLNDLKLMVSDFKKQLQKSNRENI
jgi:nucleoside-diphosphate-sugar epimerase